MRRHRRVDPSEWKGLAEELRRIVHGRRRHRTAEKLRPCDGRDPYELVAPKPDAKALALRRMSTAGPNEKARIEMDHASLAAAVLGGRPSFSPRPPRPGRRHAIRQPERLVQTIQRREGAAIASLGDRGGRNAHGPPEYI